MDPGRATRAHGVADVWGARSREIRPMKVVRWVAIKKKNDCLNARKKK